MTTTPTGREFDAAALALAFRAAGFPACVCSGTADVAVTVPHGLWPRLLDCGAVSTPDGEWLVPGDTPVEIVAVVGEMVAEDLDSLVRDEPQSTVNEAVSS